MKNPFHLKDEALKEAYDYFDQFIRPLPKNSSGQIDVKAHGLAGNDVDAFRHAYVSGVFTQEYSETAADVLGRLNEMDPLSIYSNQNNLGELNMDLWNNSVGRKYGKKMKSRKEFLKAIHKAMKDGELIPLS